MQAGDGASIEVSNGLMTLDAGVGWGSLRYGSLGDPDKQLHLNLMAGRFEVDVSMVGGSEVGGYLPLGIALYRFSDYATVPHSFPRATGGSFSQNLEAPGTYSFDLSLFGPTLNRADISDIGIGMFGLYSGGAQIDEIGLILIPEPSTYAALSALGLLGFGVLKRIRRR